MLISVQKPRKFARTARKLAPAKRRQGRGYIGLFYFIFFLLKCFVPSVGEGAIGNHHVCWISGQEFRSVDPRCFSLERKEIERTRLRQIRRIVGVGQFGNGVDSRNRCQHDSPSSRSPQLAFDRRRSIQSDSSSRCRPRPHRQSRLTAVWLTVFSLSSNTHLALDIIEWSP